MTRAVLVLLLSAAPAWADPPVLDIPDELKPAGEYVTYTPSSKTTAKAISYVGLSGVEPFPSSFLKDPRAFLLPTRNLAAGRYKFRAIGSLNDEHAAKDFVVVVGDPPPTPPVPPNPDPPKPDPKPAPAGVVKYVVIVEETAEAVAGRGAFFTDPALAARFKDKGLKWRVVDKDVKGADGRPPADVKRFLDAASGKPYPQVFLVDEKGKTLAADKVPATPADLIAFLQKNGG